MESAIDVESIAARFVTTLPHLVATGISLESVSVGRCVLRMGYQDHLVGDPASGVLHGGAVTTLIDSAFGLAVLTAMPAPGPVATLDLRIDYLRPAAPKRMLRADGHCFKLTRHIAFVRGFAYQDDPQDPVAAAQGSFLISSLAGGAGARGGQPL